jgi:RNA polymerase sigma factor (sigma-70 family)
MEVEIAAHSLWPDRLLELCRSLGAEGARSNGYGPRRTEAWVALRDALARLLRGQANKYVVITLEDQEDLASAKAFELVARAESGEWKLDGRSGGELASYLSAVARNALLDHAMRVARVISRPVLEDGADLDSTGPAPAALVSTDTAEARAMAREFIDALRRCLIRLQPQARRVWFLRAFYEMSTREIAQHPGVGLGTGHVDVLVQRARESIRTCMARKGLAAADMPTGTFAALWEFLESLRDELQPASAGEADPG